ncbi:MAG TPA: TraR/DksA C4-type zinc finger protein [Dissulfurispiraceae bacterium]|nr:TraR/DksA C4-type zinc finger protein [Dissulfurispiraceae bacterium]
MTKKKVDVIKKTPKKDTLKADPIAAPAAATEEDEGMRIERLRKVLVQKRENILKESKKEIKKQVSGENRQFVETVLDDGDLAVADVSEDINLKQLTAHRQMLIRIDAALTKLREGSYGICEECGCEIEEGRLKVMPFAICCRDCQELLEARDKIEAQHD